MLTKMFDPAIERHRRLRLIVIALIDNYFTCTYSSCHTRACTRVTYTQCKSLGSPSLVLLSHARAVTYNNATKIILLFSVICLI